MVCGHLLVGRVRKHATPRRAALACRGSMSQLVDSVQRASALKALLEIWALGLSEPSNRGCAIAAGASRPDGGIVMKKDLKVVLSSIRNVLLDPRLRPGQRDRLMKAERQLRKLARSGKWKRREVVLPVQIVTSILLEVLKS